MSSDQSTGTDDWMGTDIIEFRSQGAGVHERVIVTINGTKLTDLWVAAKQQPTDPYLQQKLERDWRPGASTASCLLVSMPTPCLMDRCRW